MQVRHSIRMATAYALIVVAGLWPLPAPAADSLRAVPFVFIGKAGDCGPPTAGSHIVTAAWLGGMGLPDRDGDAALNGVPATADDPHRGLLLSKNGPSTDCSSAGARITGVKGMTVDAAFTLGFDYRNGGHCGAGAPRFNVVAKPATGPNTSHFVGGCANAASTPAPQDPAEWSRVRFGAAQRFPPSSPRRFGSPRTMVDDLRAPRALGHLLRHDARAVHRRARAGRRAPRRPLGFSLSEGCRHGR